MIVQSLYFYGRQFVGQGFLWQKFGVILHHGTVLWFLIENKARICWFQLQNLHSFVMLFGIINKKSECILRIKKTVRIVKCFCRLLIGLSSVREQNIKNRLNWYSEDENHSRVLIFSWQTFCLTRLSMTKIWSHITSLNRFFILNVVLICWI